MHLCLIYVFSIFVCERGLAIKKEYVLPNTPQRNLRYWLFWTNTYIILYQRHFLPINHILKFPYILLDIDSAKKLYRNKTILNRIVTNSTVCPLIMQIKKQGLKLYLSITFLLSHWSLWHIVSFRPQKCKIFIINSPHFLVFILRHVYSVFILFYACIQFTPTAPRIIFQLEKKLDLV